MTIKSNNTFVDFTNTCSGTGGQYSAVKGYRSSRGSVADYLVRPGVSRVHRLQNSIEYAQRLNALEVSQVVNEKYGTTDITPSDAARFISGRSESGKYTTLKLRAGEDANFEAVCIGGKVYTPHDLHAMVLQARLSGVTSATLTAI